VLHGDICASLFLASNSLLILEHVADPSASTFSVPDGQLYRQTFAATWRLWFSRSCGVRQFVGADRHLT